MVSFQFRLFLSIFILFSNTNSLFSQIIDSEITLEKAIERTSAPKEVIEKLAIVDVEYYASDNQLHKGQIVIDSALKSDIIEIFEFIKSEQILIDMVIPIKFDLPNNGTTMAHLNNTYSFHYRPKANNSTSLSVHSLGRAIDFNPFNNPYISSSGKIIPKGALYAPKDSKSLTKNSSLVKKMEAMGWTWGGRWNSPKDYMHFEKR